MKAACIQINSNNDREANLACVTMLIREAHAQGADFVTTPECVALMAEDKADLLANAFLQDDHPALQTFQAVAEELKIWLLVGSLAVKVPEVDDKVHNRSFLLNDQGKIAAFYDKIHLYELNHAKEKNYLESDSYLSGSTMVHATLPWGKLGMTICYDVRFPHLYRRLAQGGADFIAVPSAFTRYTGQAHWEVLLRARAIENGCFIVAPAQTGNHPGNRKTYGHSMIISPWGEVLADAGEEEGVILAEIDRNKVDEVRASLPSLQHDQDFD